MKSLKNLWPLISWPFVAIGFADVHYQLTPNLWLSKTTMMIFIPYIFIGSLYVFIKRKQRIIREAAEKVTQEQEQAKEHSPNV